MSASVAIEILDHWHLPIRAAGLIASTLATAIRDHGRAVLVPSAGRTPTATYRALRDNHRQSLDWRRVHVVQMDEYRGIGANDPRSFAYYLSTEIVAPLCVGGFTHFNDKAGALVCPLDDYETAFGAIDLVVHGIGRNGHLGFNEPNASIDSKCRQVRLTPSTLLTNFPDEAERRQFAEGMTLGLTSLRAARNSLLLATGREKAEALNQACCMPPSERCPASVLRDCENVVVLADPAAAAKLRASRLKQHALQLVH